jgi:hypothetical protein
LRVFNTPQLAAEPVFKACFGVHTLDSIMVLCAVAATLNDGGVFRL